ncbi:MAG TPA: cupin domain-containing protein [Pyrinomonadaceae bacterium]|nr:cupin domain-containing protein [Pyrinomonadaceae bacterium]
MADTYRFEKWRGFAPPNPAMLRFTLDNEGYRTFMWSDRPRMFYGPHKHEENQTHWVISGCIEITVKNVGVFRLEAGDRDFMPANTIHAVEVIGDDPVLYLIGEKIAPTKKKRTKAEPKPPAEKKKRGRPKKKTLEEELLPARFLQLLKAQAED